MNWYADMSMSQAGAPHYSTSIENRSGSGQCGPGGLTLHVLAANTSKKGQVKKHKTAMRQSLATVFSLLALANGFIHESSSCANHPPKRTKVADENAFRWVASNIVGPAILASGVIVGNMNEAGAVDVTIIQSLPVTQERTTASSTANYLPRKLYPGTYQNYCGPTPEVQVKGGCIAHGWYGDAPKDQVDAACQQHDVAYCNCETKFLQRKRMKRSPTQEMQTQMDSANVDEEEPIPLLASMVALRFATKPALQVAPAIQADAEYFDCISRADKELIATGIRIRGEQQRAGCSTDPNLAWFCDLSGKGTLAAFEKVNLSIFLSDLDSDEGNSADVDASRWAVFRTRSNDRSNARETLAEIEHRRESDILRRLQTGVSVAEAASSPDVMADEEKLLNKLTARSSY